MCCDGKRDHHFSEMGGRYISGLQGDSYLLRGELRGQATTCDNHMTHYNLGQWVDFSRGLARDIDRPAMETHLSTGCARCRRIVEMLGSVAVFARSERGNEPPESALRLARAIYSRPQKPESVLAKLIYDSFRQPLPAGVRTQDRQTRHALYEAGGYYVDLRVEHQRAADLATLVGQLANRERPGTEPDDVRVELRTRKDTIATASCNRFGEFQLDYRPAPALRLDVILGDTGRRLELHLSGLMDEPARKRAKSKGILLPD